MEFNCIEVIFLFLFLSGVSCYREGSLLQPIPKRPSVDVLVTHQSTSTTFSNNQSISIQPIVSQISTAETSTIKQKNAGEDMPISTSSSTTLLANSKGVTEVLTTDYPSSLSTITTSNHKDSTPATSEVTTSHKTTKTSSTTIKIIYEATKPFNGIKQITPRDKIITKDCINMFNDVIPCKHSKSSSRTTRDLSSSLNNNIENSSKEVTKSWYFRSTRNLLSTLYSSQRGDLLAPLNNKSTPISEDSTKTTDQASNKKPGGILMPLKPENDGTSTIEDGGTSGDSSTSGSGRPGGLLAAFNSSISISSDVTSNTKQPDNGPIQAVFVGESGSGNNGQSSSSAQPSSQHSNTHLLNPVQTTSLKPNNNSKDPSSVTNPVILINSAGIGKFPNSNAKSTTVKPAALKNNAGRTSMFVPSLLTGLMMLLIYK